MYCFLAIVSFLFICTILLGRVHVLKNTYRISLILKGWFCNGSFCVCVRVVVILEENVSQHLNVLTRFCFPKFIVTSVIFSFSYYRPKEITLYPILHVDILAYSTSHF